MFLTTNLLLKMPLQNKKVSHKSRNERDKLHEYFLKKFNLTCPVHYGIRLLRNLFKMSQIQN
jgi:hypothetical protein